MISAIHNESLVVEVDSKGAELQSIKTQKEAKEYLWQADPKVWARHAPVLFPIVGRLKNDTCFIDGEEYHMSQHGFARDLEFQLIGKSSDSLSYELVSSEEILKKYPFKFNLLIQYTLYKNSLEVVYKVKNIDNKTVYFSIGAHPGFKCPLNEGERFEDYYLEFSSKETAELYLIEEGGISTKTVPHLKEDTVIPVTRELFKNDALIYKDLESESIAIRSRKSENGVKVYFKGFPYLGIWSKPQGDGDLICIEPWYGIADFVNSDGNLKHKTGIMFLDEGKTFESKYVIEIF